MTRHPTLRDAPLTLRARTAADLMIPNQISLRANASVTEAMMLFTEKRIAAAPVIDDAGQPIGVISRSDLLVHQCEHEKHRGGSYFAAPSFESNDPAHPATTRNGSRP